MSFSQFARTAGVGLAVLMALALSACSTATPLPTITSEPSATPLPPTASATITPSPLPPTATVTPTRTNTPTITPTPTPAAAFEQLQIWAAENLVGGVRINLLLPNVTVPYTLKIRGYDYTCTIEPEVKDHLFCFGLAQIQPGQTVALALLDPQSGAQIYAADVYYTGSYTATPQGIYTNNDCPQRGVDGGNCETECRQLPEGGFCVVATCGDACGLYFSVNSCPANMSEDFSSCTEDQWAEAKRLYSIP